MESKNTELRALKTLYVNFLVQGMKLHLLKPYSEERYYVSFNNTARALLLGEELYHACEDFLISYGVFNERGY